MSEYYCSNYNQVICATKSDKYIKTLKILRIDVNQICVFNNKEKKSKVKYFVEDELNFGGTHYMLTSAFYNKGDIKKGYFFIDYYGIISGYWNKFNEEDIKVCDYNPNPN